MKLLLELNLVKIYQQQSVNSHLQINECNLNLRRSLMKLSIMKNGI